MIVDSHYAGANSRETGMSTVAEVRRLFPARRSWHRQGHLLLPEIVKYNTNPLGTTDMLITPTAATVPATSATWAA